MRSACIFGASYGGYAALMSAVREPDLYKCVVGYAGVYDLQAWKEDSIYKRSLTFFNEMVGESEDEMRAQSPITYLDKLRAAVLIVHGKEDTVAPYDQAKALRDALEERQHPHEWLAKADELHGFYDVDNREELYRRAIAFIDAHIGATAGVVAEKPEK